MTHVAMHLSYATFAFHHCVHGFDESGAVERTITRMVHEGLVGWQRPVGFEDGWSTLADGGPGLAWPDRRAPGPSGQSHYCQPGRAAREGSPRGSGPWCPLPEWGRGDRLGDLPGRALALTLAGASSALPQERT